MINPEQATFVPVNAFDLSKGEARLIEDYLDLIIGGEMSYLLVSLDSFREAARSVLLLSRYLTIAEEIDSVTSTAAYVAFKGDLS